MQSESSKATKIFANDKAALVPNVHVALPPKNSSTCLLIPPATESISCGQPEQPAFLICRLLLCMTGTYVASIRLDFH